MNTAANILTTQAATATEASVFSRTMPKTLAAAT